METGELRIASSSNKALKVCNRYLQVVAKDNEKMLSFLWVPSFKLLSLPLSLCSPSPSSPLLPLPSSSPFFLPSLPLPSFPSLPSAFSPSLSPLSSICYTTNMPPGFGSISEYSALLSSTRAKNRPKHLGFDE